MRGAALGVALLVAGAGLLALGLHLYARRVFGGD